MGSSQTLGGADEGDSTVVGPFISQGTLESRGRGTKLIHGTLYRLSYTEYAQEHLLCNYIVPHCSTEFKKKHFYGWLHVIEEHIFLCNINSYVAQY